MARARDPGGSYVPLRIERGTGWFARQPAHVQRRIRGLAKLAAWKAGGVTLGDCVSRKRDPLRGTMRYERSLLALLGENAAQKWRTTLRSTGGAGRSGRRGSGRGSSGRRAGASLDPYPHLSPELKRLRGDALRLWGDSPERSRALEGILDAWETGNPNLAARIARVDGAIVTGLRALGLPRGAVRAVEVIDAGGAWFGEKAPDCTLRIAGDGLREMVRARRQPETTFRTWVHESLHARRPFAPNWMAEYATHNGYEEGLVEGLARVVVRNRAGMNPLEITYNYFVHAYRTLAVAAGIDAEALWRDLWQQPVGAVRGAVVDAVDRLQQSRSGTPLTVQQRIRLLATADRMFDRANTNVVPDDATLLAQWRTVFQ